MFFFVKQKTAYEMRISDWSSDVCSSDLRGKTAVTASNQGSSDRLQTRHSRGSGKPGFSRRDRLRPCGNDSLRYCRSCKRIDNKELARAGEIGRASCRERVCQSV